MRLTRLSRSITAAVGVLTVVLVAPEPAAAQGPVYVKRLPVARVESRVFIDEPQPGIVAPNEDDYRMTGGWIGLGVGVAADLVLRSAVDDWEIAHSAGLVLGSTLLGWFIGSQISRDLQ